MVELKEFSFAEEELEIKDLRKVKTGYPVPLHCLRFTLEAFNLYVEETYFWLLNQIRDDLGLHNVNKIVDVFSASEQSSFWGASQQRLQIQQTQASNYLKGLSEMIKSLIQIVRDLRIYDEKLSYFKAADKGDEPAWITLKGMWTDLVEGGTKSPMSVYGMAQQVGFTILPDLFFSVHPPNAKDVNQLVDALKFNQKIKEVLKRKLFSFLKWKDENQKELQVRRTFTIKYLRQHYNVIKMYISWIKPYLKSISRLTMNKKKIESADIVAAFEGATIEIEFLARRSEGKFNGCVLATFDYRTRPSDTYHQDGYAHKGPGHVGKVEVVLRSYAWTNEEIQRYIAYRDKESLELIESVDSSLKIAMEALGEDIKKYLIEAGEEFPDKKSPLEEEKAKKRKELPSMLDPFVSILKGFSELGSPLFGAGGAKKVKAPKVDKYKEEKSKKTAETTANSVLWTTYKNFKKAHKLVNW